MAGYEVHWQAKGYKAVIKEMRVYLESPKKYRLEIDLISDAGISTSSTQIGPNGEKVSHLIREK